jgi:hypothetical protein
MQANFVLSASPFHSVDVYYNSKVECLGAQVSTATPSTASASTAAVLTTSAPPPPSTLLTTAALSTTANPAISSSVPAATTAPAPFVAEHPSVVMTMSGTIDMFVEGSDRRRSFISDIAALLVISERQILIVSVKSGSIIVELAFARAAGSSESPTEIVLRLKNAAAAGKLQPLGVTNLSIDGQAASLSDSAVVTAGLSLVVVAAIVASCVVAAILHVFLFVKIKKLKAADSKEWIIISLFCGPLVWLFWSVRRRLNKVSPDGAVEDQELEKGQKSLFSTKTASVSINNSCAPDGWAGLSNRVLDIDPDDFEMRNPIDGLEKQPLLSFKAITEADAFVMKLPSAAKFTEVAYKAGRQKLHKLGPNAHGLTADEIAIIY